MTKSAVHIEWACIVFVLIVTFFYFNPFGSRGTHQRIVPKFVFGQEGNRLGEFKTPWSLAVKDNHLYVADTANNRIQILKINPDASLSAESAFGKEGKGLGELMYPSSLAIKDNHLFVADSGNQRIQVLEIKY